MKTRTHITNILSAALVLLWAPALIHQLTDFDRFRYDIQWQPLPYALTTLLIYMIPVTELIIIVSLVHPKYRYIAFLLSSILLSLFVFYMSAVLFAEQRSIIKTYGSLPSMPYVLTYWLYNMLLLILSLSGLYIQQREDNKGHLISTTT